MVSAIRLSEINGAYFIQIHLSFIPLAQLQGQRQEKKNFVQNVRLFSRIEELKNRKVHLCQWLSIGRSSIE